MMHECSPAFAYVAHGPANSDKLLLLAGREERAAHPEPASRTLDAGSRMEVVEAALEVGLMNRPKRDALSREFVHPISDTFDRRVDKFVVRLS